MIFPVQSRAPWEIFVNGRGERFVAEDVPSVDTKEHALLDQPELIFWVVFDARILRDAPWIFRQKKPHEVEAAFASHPNFVKADTLDGLAKACGMDPTRFCKTVETYNAAHASGRDPLGRKHIPAPIAEPPFYAIKNHGSVARTFAGLRVSDGLQVLDTGDRPIANLYAAGEVVGASTFAGQSFAGGMSITPALGFDRLLGEKLLKW